MSMTHPHRSAWRRTRPAVAVTGVGALAALLAGCTVVPPAPPDSIPESAPAAAVPVSAVSGVPDGSARPGSALADHSAEAATGQPLPPGVPEPPAATTQVVTVLVPTAASTSGTLRAWQRGPGGWTSALGPVRVRVGTDGVGAASESANRTPRGTFSLDQAFGRQPDPGTALPYRRVGTSDWWVSDTTSPAYNTYRHCAPGSCAFREAAGENLGRAGASYDYALVIGYNTAPVRSGAGSAFFVHVDAGAPSQGCIEVPRVSQVALLRWLAPSAHPRITIGLGAP
jgi:L,D-peptidoglycan transpeptidase YkuD (ErfK/YbiS/YcfS/YnhG family)